MFTRRWPQWSKHVVKIKIIYAIIQFDVVLAAFKVIIGKRTTGIIR
jgi:hypothetical protein